MAEAVREMSTRRGGIVGQTGVPAARLAGLPAAGIQRDGHCGDVDPCGFWFSICPEHLAVARRVNLQAITDREAVLDFDFGLAARRVQPITSPT